MRTEYFVRYEQDGTKWYTDGTSLNDARSAADFRKKNGATNIEIVQRDITEIVLEKIN